MDDARFLDDLAARQRAAWPAGIPTAPVWPHGEVTLTASLRAWARQHPRRTAIDWYGARIDYATLDDLSDRCAAVLAAHGVAASDRVAVMMGNCPQFHVAFYGILKLGAVYVPVNPLFREDELVYELDDAQATTAIVLDTLAPMLMRVRERTAVRTVFVTAAGELLPDAPQGPLPPGLQAPLAPVQGALDFLSALRTLPAAEVRPLPDGDLDALAALNYTGGTTGLPKGCMHTQRDMVYTAAATLATSGTADAPGGGAGEVILNYLPMFWIAGENQGLVYPVFTGATLVLLARWDPVAVMAAIDRCRVTRTFLVVDNLVEILRHPDRTRYDLSTVARTRCASFVRKLTRDLRAEWAALTGGGLVAEGAWGMTETHTSDTFTTGMQAFDLEGRPVFVGLPVPGTRVTIRDFDTGALLPLGAEGEIVVSTPSLFKGYWRRPEASAEAIRDGAFRTGDIGCLDEQGYLHFLGRRKEMLKVRGMSVFPSELEVMLGRHEAILGCAVLGRADAERGQVPVAFVRLRPEHAGRVDAAAIQGWCRAHMATYKVPEVRIVDTLPLTATGKVRKVELQAVLDAEAD